MSHIAWLNIMKIVSTMMKTPTELYWHISEIDYLADNDLGDGDSDHDDYYDYRIMIKEVDFEQLHFFVQTFTSTIQRLL